MSTHANIIHYANVEDESTGEAFEVFQFVKVGGRRDRLIVERGLADDPKQVRLHLRNRNAALSPAFNESIREVEAAIRAEPLGLLRYAARNGWLADNTGFVNSSGTIDSKDRQQEILPPPPAQHRAVPRREVGRRLAKLDQKRRRPLPLFGLGDDRAVRGIRRASVEADCPEFFRSQHFRGCEDWQKHGSARRFIGRRRRP
jgi:hypothetical protein